VQTGLHDLGAAQTGLHEFRAASTLILGGRREVEVLTDEAIFLLQGWIAVRLFSSNL